MALPAVTNPADTPGLIFRMGVGTLYPLARTLTRFDHHGGENLPGPGPALVVSNHVSNYDPIVLGSFLVANGRWPHWLAKKELFSVPIVGWVASASGQISVDRKGPNPAKVLDDAKAGLDKGMTVVMYPEGTITADPLHWPMTGRTGAARLALETGVPVIPSTPRSPVLAESSRRRTVTTCARGGGFPSRLLLRGQSSTLGDVMPR